MRKIALVATAGLSALALAGCAQEVQTIVAPTDAAEATTSAPTPQATASPTPSAPAESAPPAGTPAPSASAPESPNPSASAPANPAGKTPTLGMSEAAHKCATEIDRVLFLEPKGIAGDDGFDPHYSAELFNVQVVDGEWHFEFIPETEEMAKATCHTQGTQVVSMTREEFELAMRGYTYDGYREVVINQ